MSSTIGDAALAEASAATLAAIIEQLPVAVAVCDRRGRAILQNRRMQRFAGGFLPPQTDADDVVSRWRRPDGERIELTEYPCARALRGETDRGTEFLYRNDDDSETWTCVATAPLTSATGEVAGAIVVVHDIDANRRGEARMGSLAEERQRRIEELETLLRALPVGVFIARDKACLDISMNPAGAAMLRLPEHGNASKTAPGGEALPFRVFKDGAEVPDEELPMQRAASSGQHVAGEELELRFEGGETVTLFEHAAPLYTADGTTRGCVGVFVDITEQKRTERLLLEQKQLLEQHAERLREADRRKDEFLATLAHELRNPLAPIRQAARVATSPNASAEQVRWSHEVIERQARHMALLLDDLLDVSRITRGQLQLRREPVELAGVIATAVETARPLIDARRHRLAMRLPEEPIRLEADAVRLAQVLGNLLANAAKYSEPEGQITLTAALESGNVVIRVRDTGIGIEPHMLPRVFEMFSQATGALERAEGGLGIGLALVKGLVELHGGTVNARSEGAGQGSEFVVSLPQKLTPRGAGPRMENRPAVVARGPRRILVADDNRDAAESLKMLLDLEGHEVHAAHDGERALELAVHVKPEVMLLDIGMPKLNGYEVARRVRQAAWGGEVKLVAITGWGQAEDRERARAAGFDHHLTKPVDHDVVQSLLQQLA